jgi:hypothetical protein
MSVSVAGSEFCSDSSISSSYPGGSPSLLGIAVVLTLWGMLMFGLAVFRASHFVWSKAIIAFLVGLVSWIIAVILYSTWLQLRDGGE